jgi:hypothetical protein
MSRRRRLEINQDGRGHESQARLRRPLARKNKVRYAQVSVSRGQCTAQTRMSSRKKKEAIFGEGGELFIVPSSSSLLSVHTFALNPLPNPLFGKHA